jgi:hypothetical protein
MAGKDKSYIWKEDKLILKDVCFECGVTKKTHQIHYHHVVPHIKGGKNAIPLCVDCHDKVHGGYMKKLGGMQSTILMNEGRKRAMERGVVFGRKEGYREEKDVFMNKPKSKEVIELLKKGKTYKEISDIVGVGEGKISKVKKLLIEDGVIQVNEKNRTIIRYQRKFF